MAKHGLSWFMAAQYCNQLSDAAGLERCYTCTNDRYRTGRCELSDSWPTPYDCPGYRLPTEAEWEYAARAGTTSTTYNGDPEHPSSFVSCDFDTPEFPTLDAISWWCGNSEERTHPVGSLSPNPWGLYDMIGNVSEWCHDRSAIEIRNSDPEATFIDPHGDEEVRRRATRGGHLLSEWWNLRADYSSCSARDDVWIMLGFRVARTLDL